MEGRVTLDGAAVAHARVFLVDAEPEIVAATESDETGAFRLTSAADAPVAWLLVVLADTPLVGARALPFRSGAGPQDVAFRSADGHALRGTIELPAGVAWDWVAVHVTPKSLAGVPAALVPLVLRTGVTPGKRSVLASWVLGEPAFDVRVMTGRWRLEVDRRVDGPDQPPGAAPPQLELVSATSADGTVLESPIGVVLDVSSDRQLVVRLGVVAER